MNRVEPILEIREFAAGYHGKPVLRSVNLLLTKGEICGVIGEEGSGKSTLLKAITQQLKNTGVIELHGRSLRKIDPSGMMRIGVDFLPQGGSILPNFTVEEHICLAVSRFDRTRKEMAWQKVQARFPKVVGLRKQIAGRLSGGERIMLSLACLIATDAALWLLDEPTAGLAPDTCETIKDFLTEMKVEREKTILLLEHNYDLAFDLADSVMLLKQGKLSDKFSRETFTRPGFIERELYGLKK